MAGLATRTDGRSEVNLIAGAGALPLAVERWPNALGERVILMHGGGQTRHAWGETAASLADLGFEVASMDLRGHGDSGWSADGDYGLSAFRDDLFAVMETDPRPAALVGASLGGVAALAAAGEAPPRTVTALVLVDITHAPPAVGAARIQRFMGAHPDGFASLDEAVDAVAAYLPHRPRPKAPSGLMKNLRPRGGRLRWHWDPAFTSVALADRLADPMRLERAVRALSAPTLLVRGEESEIVTPDDAAAFVALAPHARVVEIAGARHMVAGDRNTAFGEAVTAFLTARAA